MKNKTLLTVVLILVGMLLFSCENSSEQDLFGSESNLTTETSLNTKAANEFIVSPTGIDDTQNLQTALNNAALYGKGSIVKLEAGTYYTDKIFVENFKGTIEGAGIGHTIIKSVPNLDYPDIDWEEIPSSDNLWPYLFTFREGNFKISDLSVHITEYEPTTGWDIGGGEITKALCGVFNIVGHTVHTKFNRIEIKGSIGTLWGMNLLTGIVNQGTLSEPFIFKGIHFLQSSIFENIIWAYTIGPASDVTAIIGGSPQHQNSFVNVLDAVDILDISNSKIIISHNIMEKVGSAGILFGQGYFGFQSLIEKPTSMVANHNKIILNPNEPYANGFILADYGMHDGYGAKIKAHIFNNRITLTNNNHGGIFGFSGENINIGKNTLSGDGLAGIYLGVYGDYPTNWQLIHNNTQELSTSIAPVWLGEGTSNIKVITKNPTDVLDEGQNNMITGPHALLTKQAKKNTNLVLKARKNLKRPFK